MRTKTKKRMLAAVSLLLIACMTFTFAGCGKKKPNSVGGDLNPDAGSVEIVKKDWKSTDGFWDFTDNVFCQTETDAQGRLVYVKEVEQDYVTISAQVKLQRDGAKAGFEFRTNRERELPDITLTSFTLSTDNNATITAQSSADRSGRYNKPFAVEKNKWYTIKIVLNGTDAEYYIDNTLVERRTDCPVKAGNKYFALIGEQADTRIRNVEIETYEPTNTEWEELLNQSDLVKEGYDRFSATYFEYPYVGFGRTSLLVSPYGFLTPKVKRPSSIGTNYRDDPQFIYDLWWDDSIKVDPFTFAGGYSVNGKLEEGEILNDGKCAYKQTVDIDSGVLTTDLTLSVDNKYVTTTRQMVVDENGVVVMKIVNDAQKQFMFRLTTRDAVFGHLTYDKKNDGYLASCDLRKDTAHKAYVRVKAVSEAGFSVQDDGTLLFDATDKPIYLYLAPESDLTFEEEHDAAANAEAIVSAAATAGYDKTVKAAQEWYKDFYSVGRISIPDLGMAKWYVRSLYYHAVSMAGTRVPPGCYSNNVAGFFGGPCPEFDLSLSQYMLLMTNHADLAQTTVDWYDNTRETLRANAESGYTDKTGHSHEAVEGGYLIPWIASWDGSPTHGVEVGHEQGWVSMFAGANAASFILNQADYLNADRALAKDIMLGQLRMMMSFFKEINGKWVHEGVWAGGDNYSAGSFSESMAAVYSLVTIDEMRQDNPELFTSGENAEIDAWLLRLPDMPPYGDQFTVTFDPDKSMYTIGHTTAEIPEMITEGTGYVGGPTNNVYFWYKLLPYNDRNLPGTLVSIAESGQFDYHFNTGWSATVAARAGLSDFAFDYTRYMLRPGSVYDDWYMTENVNDSEDFKRSPELGAHGAYAMAISAMMFDGETDEYIKAFGAIPSDWQKAGVSFDKMSAVGNIEVSGKYSDIETTLTLKNLSTRNAVRDVYVRVKEGSGAAIYNGKEYDITDGCMALIENVEIPAGESVTLSVQGKQKDVTIENFEGLSPVSGSDKVRTQNLPFSWTSAPHASSYRLVVSKYSDLSTPVFDKNVGLTTLYYPLDTQARISLSEGTQYYWTVYAVHGSSEKQMNQGVLSFKTKGGGAAPVDPLPEGSTVNAFGKTWQVNQYAAAVDGGIEVTSIVGYQEDNPTGAYFETDRDFVVIVTVETGSLGKVGIEMWANGGYQFVRTEDGKITSYGSLAQGGTGDGPAVDGKVTFRLSRLNGKVATYYKLDGESEFTQIMEGDLAPALSGKTVRVYLCAISSYSAQSTQIWGRFTDYAEDIKDGGGTTDPDEPDIEAEPVNKGETVTIDGITFTASDGAKVVKGNGGEVESLVVDSILGRNEPNPTGFYTEVTQNFVFTAKFSYTGLGRSGIVLIDGSGKYMFMRADTGNIASYGDMKAGPGSGNAGFVTDPIYFRIALENGILYTAYSADGENFTKVVSDVKLDYGESDTFRLWCYATQYSESDSTEGAVFSDLTLTRSQYEQPSSGIPAGSNIELAGKQFTTASEITKDGDDVIISGAGMGDNAPAGIYTELTGDFTLVAKVDISIDAGVTAGLTFMNQDGSYMFMRATASNTFESYGNLNTGASGKGGTDIGFTGGEITLKAVRSGNTVTVYYSLDNGTTFEQFNALVIDDSKVSASGTLKVYLSVSGGGVTSQLTVKECTITQ